MYSATYLPDVHTARKELARLTAIETNLRKQIIDLRTNYQGNNSAETWARQTRRPQLWSASLFVQVSSGRCLAA